MIQVTAAEIILFVRSLDNRNLKTQAQGKSFTVDLLGDGIVYVPASTGKARPHGAKWLSRFCEEFSRTNSLRPGDYTQVTVNSAYALALVSALLKSQRTS